MYDFRFLIRSTAADFSSFNFNCKIGSTTFVCGAANSLLITLKGENQFDSFFDLLLLALLSGWPQKTNELTEKTVKKVFDALLFILKTFQASEVIQSFKKLFGC